MVEERSAGELEDLAPASATPDDRPPQAPAPPVTTAMRVALNGSMAVFATSVVAPTLLAAWAVVVVAAVGLGSFGLVHAGALEPRTLGPASAIGVVLALSLALGTLRLPGPRPVAAGEESYPAFATLLGLIIVAGVTTLAALPHSPFFPYPLATIAVVAATTYLAAAGLVAATWVTIALARRANRWSTHGIYRAGFMTATSLLLGAAGVVALTQRVYVAPLRAAASELEMAQVPGPSGVFDAAPTVLCLGAGEVAPTLARSGASAPACSFLPHSDARTTDECFVHLASTSLPRTLTRLRASYRCDADCEDLVMDALIATCTRVPPARDPEGFFNKVASNSALRWRRGDAKTIRCEDLDEVPDDPCAWSRGEDLDDKIDAFAREATCRLPPFERQVVRHRLRDWSFREVGDKLGITEAKARNTYHNTMRRLRGELSDWRAQCQIPQ